MLNLKILYVVVCAGSPNSSMTTAAGHTLSSAPGKGGADAVSLSYHVFTLTVLGAYFMQFIDH